MMATYSAINAAQKTIIPLLLQNLTAKTVFQTYKRQLPFPALKQPKIINLVQPLPHISQLLKIQAKPPRSDLPRKAQMSKTKSKTIILPN